MPLSALVGTAAVQIGSAFCLGVATWRQFGRQFAVFPTISVAGNPQSPSETLQLIDFF
jgi:hypothetical protein